MLVLGVWKSLNQMSTKFTQKQDDGSLEISVYLTNVGHALAFPHLADSEQWLPL